MEQRRTELEFDEFEKLLGEIPNVTSGNANSVPLCANSYTGPLSQKIQSNGHLDDREVVNLPDDHSFTSAFSELSLKGGSTRPAMTSHQENPHLVYFPSYNSPNNMPYSFDRSDVRKFDPQLFKRLQQVGYVHNFSSGIPNLNALQGCQFVQGVEFAAMSDHQPQCLPSTQSSSHFFQPLPLNQFRGMRMQEEQYFRVNPHFLYPHNHSQEIQNKLMSSRHEYFTRPDSWRVELSNGDRFWNENVALRGLNKTRKPSYSEKILRRSQLGLNMAKTMNYYSPGYESHNDIKRNERVKLQNQIDDLSSWDLCSDTMNPKNNNPRLQSHEYDSVEEAREKIYFMAKDQHGCRFLQDKISERNPDDIDIIFCETINHIVELMTDPFGNYLVQKLLEVCNEDQRMQIILAMTRKPGELIRISCDMHGTRGVQKVVETIKTSEQVSMVVSALKPGVANLMKNMNGNHVAQRCLQYFLPQCCKFLFEAAVTHCFELATDRHGCCVLQKCLSHSEGENRHRIVSKLTSNALILSQDPFGNYVLQFVFEFQLQWAIREIVDQLEGNYTDLSMQKCSSNVVEKCLKYGTDEHRARIIRELVKTARLDQVMQDPFGNYVMQTALKQSKGIIHTELVNAVRPHIRSLRTNPYGKKVLSALCSKK